MTTACAVSRLSVTPVKGLLLHHPQFVELTALGAVGDRRFYLLDDSGTLQSCTRNPGLFGLRADYDAATGHLQVARGDDVLVAGVVEPAGAVDTDMWGLRTITGDFVADARWSEAFSDLTGKRVHLVRARDSAYDVHPATLMGAASVDELMRRHGEASIDSRRFRMLLEFSGGPPPIEDSWHGSRLLINGATLEVCGPVKRCAATTRHPDSGVVDLQTLRMITAYRGRQPSALGRGPTSGVYAKVLEPGRVSVGHLVEVRALN
jgi:uncharacterized protein YcbX